MPERTLCMAWATREWECSSDGQDKRRLAQLDSLRAGSRIERSSVSALSAPREAVQALRAAPISLVTVEARQWKGGGRGAVDSIARALIDCWPWWAVGTLGSGVAWARVGCTFQKLAEHAARRPGWRASGCVPSCWLPLAHPEPSTPHLRTPCLIFLPQPPPSPRQHTATPAQHSALQALSACHRLQPSLLSLSPVDATRLTTADNIRRGPYRVAIAQLMSR